MQNKTVREKRWALTAQNANGQAVDCDLSKTNDLVCDMGRVPASPNVAAETVIEVAVDAPPGNVVVTVRPIA